MEDFYDDYNYENSTFNFSYDDYPSVCEKSDVRSFAALFLPVVYSLCLVIGLAGNALVVAVYIYYKRLKTMTDVFLTHLAVADLLLLSTLPFWALDAARGWILGEALCKIVSSCYTFNFACCMLLLACISIDRYLALTKMRGGNGARCFQKIFTRKNCWKVCIVIWASAFLLGLPDFLVSEVRHSGNRSFCLAVYASSMGKTGKATIEMLEVVLGFLIPLSIMTVCYCKVGFALGKLPTQSKSKRWKAIRVLLITVAAFVITQLPYNVLKVYQTMDSVYNIVTHCETSKLMDQASHVSESLALTHCCINPLLYTFAGSSFRKYLMKAAKRVGENNRRRRPRTYDVEMSFNSHSESQKTDSFSI
ncbi:atypical chemokine receptor 4 [Eucyclogobius newberryi]|uniref:atypical chemokine receptor 4 n=1 Tax=Eucyclogobius newberryi TaxID=166745 RepID=UPI003B5B302A